MNKFVFLIVSTFLICFNSQAAVVGITDSGIDFEHEELAQTAWSNPYEIPKNRLDDDLNGKVDDINGWNFADDYNRVFYREHLASVHPIVFTLIRIVARKQAQIETPEDKKFWEDNFEKLPPKEKTKLANHLGFYGQYAHGTHVAGIVNHQAPEAKLVALRIFPDTMPPEYEPKQAVEIGTFGFLDQIYKILSAFSNGTFTEAAKYYAEKKIDIANYSLGVAITQLARNALFIKGKLKPTEAELSTETLRMYKSYEEQGRVWMQGAPHTLFVIAAGNEGKDNDLFPVFPGNIRADNSITVAATYGWDRLAKFSCYGKTTVDIAAPGVAIVSTVPSLDRKGRLPLSGTSMAAPFITGVSAHIKSLNPALQPAQIKKILMETVDIKEWLKDKVVSQGVVNPDRAYHAASRSLTLTLEQAIREAKQLVLDHPFNPEVTKQSSWTQTPNSSLDSWADKIVF